MNAEMSVASSAAPRRAATADVQINTVAGPVTPAELGITIAHEHLRTRQEAAYTQFPHLYDDDHAAAVIVAELTRAREFGLQSYCDATAPGLGRDVRFAQRIAEESGVRILMATGYYTFDAVPTYFAHRDIDVLAEAFVHDITVGIQGTAAKAAYLKCATDESGITPGVEKVLRAVARAHRATGAPIMTHSVPALRNGLDQLDVFEDEGADLRSVMIGHCGDSTDVDYLEQIGRRGASLGMDRYGMSDRLPFEARTATILEMCRRGFADRIMLAQDHSIVRDIILPESQLAQRPEWSTHLVLERVVPELISQGLEHDLALAMVRENVHRWLTPRIGSVAIAATGADDEP
jgi:phosphotriesterase-related protein